MAKKKPGDVFYDSKLVVYVSKKQKKKIITFCKESGKTMSEWTREMIDGLPE